MSLISLQQFPNSFFDPFLVTSTETPEYNCIAWAYEDMTRWYWPDPSNIYFWPDGIPREVNLNSFMQLFSSIRYEICENGEPEEGFCKIAIFIDPNGIPTHAARQLLNGFWTSKLGKYIDVQHTIQSIIDGDYGAVGVYMKRAINGNHEMQ